MNRLKILSVFVLGVMAITITLGAVVYRSVNASPSTNQAADTTGSTDSSIPPGKGHAGGSYGYSDEDLAAALGITVDELTAARQKANETALTQAVEQGLITQAQADDASTSGRQWKGWLSKNGFDFDTFLAEALGITIEKLQDAYLQAYTTRIDQAVTDGTLTQEQADLMKGQYALRANNVFQDSMQAAFEAAVQQAVKDGVITQSQADLILENASSQGMSGFLGKSGPHGFGDIGGGRGGGRHAGGHLENNPSADTPADHLEATPTP